MFPKLPGYSDGDQIACTDIARCSSCPFTKSPTKQAYDQIAQLKCENKNYSFCGLIGSIKKYIIEPKQERPSDFPEFFVVECGGCR